MGKNVQKLGPGRLIIASHNQGKIIEINDLVSPYGIEAVSAASLGLEDPEETEKNLRRERCIEGESRRKGGKPARAGR